MLAKKKIKRKKKKRGFIFWAYIGRYSKTKKHGVRGLNGLFMEGEKHMAQEGMMIPSLH
jgi:hypothetical protein